MSDSSPMHTLFTNSLSDDILLLSTYLSGRHGSPCTSSPVDENMALYTDISTLLTIDNHHDHQRLNFPAVFGKATVNVIDFLVYVENAIPHGLGQSGVNGNQIDVVAENDRCSSSVGGRIPTYMGRDYGEDYDCGNENLADLVCITPIKEHGLRLLSHWDSQALNQRRVQTRKDLTLETHLRDLFDVIAALNCSDMADLFRFQLFIHDRIYHTLGLRVLKFSTHWGKSPFDILSDHLDPELKSKTLTFKYQDAHFEALLQSYVPASNPPLETQTRRVFCVNAGNASLWLSALKGIWGHMERYLLVEKSVEGKSTLHVRPEPQSSHIIDSIVALMYVFESLMPVLKHLLSARGAAQALASAGQSYQPYQPFTWL